MEVTRIRELTHPYITPWSVIARVEMEVTRIRELTQIGVSQKNSLLIGRNGSYPNKGIDTSFKDVHILIERVRRNGSYPNKGIDTPFLSHSFLSLI